MAGRNFYCLVEIATNFSMWNTFPGQEKVMKCPDLSSFQTFFYSNGTQKELPLHMYKLLKCKALWGILSLPKVITEINYNVRTYVRYNDSTQSRVLSGVWSVRWFIGAEGVCQCTAAGGQFLRVEGWRLHKR